MVPVPLLQCARGHYCRLHKDYSSGGRDESQTNACLLHGASQSRCRVWPELLGPAAYTNPGDIRVHQDIHSARHGRRCCEESLDKKATSDVFGEYKRKKEMASETAR